MSKAEIEFRQLFAKALKGDLGAARHAVNLAIEYLAPEVRSPSHYEMICTSDAVKRFGRNYPDHVAKLNMSRGYRI
jgi:hypothetical protein